MAHLQASEAKHVASPEIESDRKTYSNLKAKYMQEMYERMERDKQVVVDELDKQKQANSKLASELKKLKEELGMSYFALISNRKRKEQKPGHQATRRADRPARNGDKAEQPESRG